MGNVCGAVEKIDTAFILLKNLKCQQLLAFFTFMSRISFMLSWVELEKSFMNSRPGLHCPVYLELGAQTRPTSLSWYVILTKS